MRHSFLAGIIAFVAVSSIAQIQPKEVSFDDLYSQIAVDLRSSWRCNSSNPLVPAFWCRKDQEIDNALGSAAFKLRAARSACGLSSEDANSVLMSKLPTGLRCGGDDRCNMANLGLFNSSLEDADPSKGDCSTIKYALERLREEEVRSRATEAFWRCVDTTARTIDDRISPADSVATGVWGMCQSAFAASGQGQRSLANNPYVKDAVMPKIVARVLAERARSKQASPPAPSKPRRVPAPTT